MAAVPSPRPSPRPSGAGEPTHGPQLRVVDEPRHTGRYMLLLALVAVLGVTGIVSLNALAAEASFKARELEEEVTRLSRRYDELTAEVAKLESPERVRRVATTELGMVPADPLYLSPEGKRTARPANADPQSPASGDARRENDADAESGADDGAAGLSDGERSDDFDEAEATP